MRAPARNASRLILVEDGAGLTGQLVSVIGSHVPKAADEDAERIRHERKPCLIQERPAERTHPPTEPQLCFQQAAYLQRLERCRYQQSRREHNYDAGEVAAVQAGNHPANCHEDQARHEHEREAVVDPQLAQDLGIAPQGLSPSTEEHHSRFLDERPDELIHEEHGRPADRERADGE